jgi:hypothetical protein
LPRAAAEAEETGVPDCDAHIDHSRRGSRFHNKCSDRLDKGDPVDRRERDMNTFRVSVRASPELFGTILEGASRLASDYGCMFWWKPYPENRYELTFTDHNVALLYRALLARLLMDEPSDFALEGLERMKSEPRHE